MTEESNHWPRESDVAMWHRLSGYPDNVTDDGQVVSADEGRRDQTEKKLLRAAIADLSQLGLPDEVRSAARLAASYLLAGDVETARRYVLRGRELLDEHRKATDYES
jgi:hypothetical protein